MKKSLVLIGVASVLLLSGCTNSEVKTEIKLQLSENEYLYAKYSGYFDISRGQTVETVSPQLLSELRAEMEPAKEEAVAVLTKMIVSAAEPVPALAGVFNKVKATWVTDEEPNTWIITINREINGNRVTRLLETPADGGFWETYSNEEVFQYLNNINRLLRDPSYLTGLGIEPDTTEFGIENPLFIILRPNLKPDGTFDEGSTVGLAHFNDTALLNTIFSFRTFKAELLRDMNLIWGLKPVIGSEDYFELHAVKATRDGRPMLKCESIVSATVDKKNYPPVVTINMNAEGAQKWAVMTRENVGRNLAFVMKNKVYFSPGVAQEIVSGSSTISADFTEEEAADLAILLGSGYLPPFGVRVLSIR